VNPFLSFSQGFDLGKRQEAIGSKKEKKVILPEVQSEAEILFIM
jgi:hypothetical protein